MKKLLHLVITLFSFSAIATPFFYSGRLVDTAGAPYTGNADMSFRLFINGSATTCAYANNSVPLSNGIFNIAIDFDNPSATCNSGSSSLAQTLETAVTAGQIIEIEVTHNNALPTTVTYPRQLIGAAPISIYSVNAAATIPADSIAGSDISGVDSCLASEVLSLNSSGSFICVTLPSAGVTSVASGNNAITIGGTAASPIVSLNIANMSCLAGSSIGSINADGTVNCETDDGRVNSINGQNQGTQNLAVGSSGSAPAWNSAAGTHTLNIPNAASAGVSAGLISKTKYDEFDRAGSLFDASSTMTAGRTCVYDGTRITCNTLASGAPTGAAGGSLAGTYPNPTLANNAVNTAAVANGAISAEKLQGSLTAAGCAAGQVLSINSSGNFICVADSGFGGGSNPTGSAGGGLTGTYPNPTIAADAIGSAQVAANSLTAADLAANSVTAGELANGAVTNTKIFGMTVNCASGEVIKANGSGGFNCAVDIGGGAPSGVAGGDLSGTYPNPTIANNTIDSNNIIIDSIAAVDIAANAVGVSELANNAVDTAAVIDGAISATKLQGSLTAAGCSAGQVLTINSSGNFVCVADSGFGGGSSPTGAASGELAGTYPSPVIADNIIDAANIMANAVGASELANNAVDTAAVANGAITNTKISGLAANCSAGEVMKANGAGGFTCAADNNTVTTDTTLSGSAAGGDLTGTYPNPTLAANSVNSSEIANNAVGTSEVLDSSITAAKLVGSTTVCLASQVLTINAVGNFVCTNDQVGGAPTGSAGGDLTGTYPNPSIAANAVGTTEINNGAITNTKISGLAANCSVGQVMKANGSGGFTCANDIDTTVADTTLSGTAAGGELNGTYPNPVIRDNIIDAANIMANAVGASELANNAVDTAAVIDGAISATKLQGSLSAAGCGSGQVLTINSSGNFVCVADSGFGGGSSPTGAASGELAGTYPNPIIADNIIDAANIMANAVNTSELAAQSVTNTKMNGITTNCSSGQVMKANGLGGFTCASDNSGGAPSGTAGGDLTGTYPNPTLAANSVAAAEIAANAVGQNEIATNGVGALELANSSVDTAAIQTGAVTNTKMQGIIANCASGQVMKANGTGGFTCASDNSGGAPSGAAGGDLTGTYPNPTLAANSVAAAEIAANAVGQSEIATNGVASAEVQDNSLTAADLAAGSVGTSEVADNSLTATDLAANSVAASEIAANAVGSSELAPQAVFQTNMAGITTNCATGQVLKASSTAGQFVCATDNAGSGADNLGNHSATMRLDMNDRVIQEVNEVIFNDGVNHSIGSNASGLVFDGGDGTADFLIYDDIIYSDQLRLGYTGSAVLSTHDTNENLLIDPNGSGATIFSGTVNLGNNQVQGSEIQDATITAADLATNSVAAAEIAANAVNTSELAAQSVTNTKMNGITANCSSGQVMKANGTGGFTCASDNSGGAPSGAAGGDLTGTYPNPTLAANSVAAAEIAANAVGQSEIATNGVASAEVQDNSLTAADLAASSVGTSEVADNSLTAADLATNSVAAAEIAANAVNTSELAAQSVTNTKMNGITANCSSGQVMKANGTGGFTCASDNSGGAPSGAAGGDLTGAYPNPTLAANSVAAAEIAANAVGQSEIATNGVASAEVQDNSLTAADLAAGSVGTSEVADNSLTATDLAANSVTASEIATNAVAAAEIAANAVNTSELAAQSVTNTKMNGITANCSSGQVMKANGTGGFTCSTDLQGLTSDVYVNTTGDTMTGDLLIQKNNSWFTLDSSSSGANGVEQAAGISVGEGGKKGSAALHLTYTGDGYGHLGMGAVSATTSLPAFEAMRFYYLNNSTTFLGTVNLGTAQVQGSEIQDATITAADLATNSVAAAEIAANAVGSSELAPQAVFQTNMAGITSNCATGQVLKASSTAGQFVCAADNAGSGADNLGNHSATTTLQLNNNLVSEVSELRFNQGGNYSIGTNINGLVMDGGDGTADFLVYDDRVYTDNITMGYNGSATLTTYDSNENLTIDPSGTGATTFVGTVNLGSSQVQGSEIQDATITAADLATNSVAAAEIAANAVGSSELAPQAVFQTNMAGITSNCATGQVLKASSTAGQFVCATDNAGSAADNLGNHTATTTLNLNNQNMTNINNVSLRAVDSYDKLRVWNSGSYAIGMNSAMTYGALNDFAMTFTMSNTAARGFVWRDSSDAKSDGAMSLSTAGLLRVKGSVTAASFIWNSDRRLKKNISSYDNALEKVLALRGVNFTWDTKDKVGYDTNDGVDDIGFIAQEVADIEPDLVLEDGNGYLSVKYANMSAMIVESIKEMHERQRLLEKENSRKFLKIKRENKNLKKKVDNLEQRLKKLERLLLND